MDLTNTDIISLHENLQSFAKHHENRGAIKAHELIKAKLKNDTETVRNGAKGMDKYYSGYDNAINDVLKLIRENFIP
jgi:hypothetical protein